MKDIFFFALILDPSQKNKIREYLHDKIRRDEVFFIFYSMGSARLGSGIFTCHQKAYNFFLLLSL